jgi:putative ABC transport system ATP-binding protein
MIRLKNLTKIFNKGSINENLAVDRVSIEVKKGDFITVIGSNGAGKSTLLNLIAGVYPPDTGRIIIDSSNVTPLKEHQRAKFIGRVFQDPMMGTSGSMTIEENFSIALARGRRRTLSFGVNHASRELFKSRLALLGLGLEDRLRDKVGLLSGGQRQSLTLLMATLNSPKVLLLDEHTAALDPKTAKLVMDLTRRIIEKYELTTVMITHNMQQALSNGNRLIMMHLGKIVFDVKGPERDRLTVDDLLDHFGKLRGTLSDKTLLSIKSEAP